MKHLFSIAVLATLHLSAQAQKGVYQDLLMMYVDEKYERCIHKAMGYTENNATKRDPLPFLYVAMCYHEMSKAESYLADYPKASREALKWAEKYRRKDKDLEYFKEYEDFWASLNKAAVDEGENELDNPKGLSRARQVFLSMTKYYPENPGPWLLLAVCQHKANLAREAEVSIKEFDKALQAAGDISKLPPDQRKTLKTALIRFADLMTEKGMKDQARKYVAFGKDHFMDQPDFKGLYDTLF